MPHNHLDHGILKYTLSDHYFIFTTLKFRRQASPPKLIHKKDYNGININDFIRDLMDIGLYSGVIDAKSTSDAWRDWPNAFNTVVSKHVKIKEIRVKDRSNPWMTNEILAFIYINVIILTAWHGRISSSNKMSEYKKLRNFVISTIRNSQQSYYKKTITANISCDVWRAVNQSLGKNRKSSITSDLSPDAWNEHFASVGNKLCSKFSENDENDEIAI